MSEFDIAANRRSGRRATRPSSTSPLPSGRAVCGVPRLVEEMLGAAGIGRPSTRARRRAGDRRGARPRSELVALRDAARRCVTTTRSRLRRSCASCTGACSGTRRRTPGRAGMRTGPVRQDGHMSRLTWNLVRDLAGFCASEPRALSFYVRLDPSESPTPQALSTRFNSLLTQVEKASSRTARSRTRSRRSGTAWIASGMGGERVRPGRCARCRRLRLGRRRLLARRAHPGSRRRPRRGRPAVRRRSARPPRAGRRDLRRAGDRERGTVFRLVDGHLEEIADESDEVPGRHDQGGWSQARYQRHIEKLVRDHLKTVGGELEGELRRSGSPRLVVVAPDELRSEIEAQLSPETKRRGRGLGARRAALDAGRAARGRPADSGRGARSGRPGRARALARAAGSARSRQLRVGGHARGGVRRARRAVAREPRVRRNGVPLPGSVRVRLPAPARARSTARRSRSTMRSSSRCTSTPRSRRPGPHARRGPRRPRIGRRAAALLAAVHGRAPRATPVGYPLGSAPEQAGRLVMTADLNDELTSYLG